MPPHTGLPSRISLPSVPQQPGRRDFPFVAAFAPVVGSLVIWGITGSPFALVFAVLGPVVAVGSLLDSCRHNRRSTRAGAERYQREVDAVLGGVEAAHRSEREALFVPVLQPRELLAGAIRDPEWWRHRWGEPLPVCLGTGSIPSALELDPLPVGASQLVERAHARVLAATNVLTDAPIMVDARYGIGIVGPAVPAASLARAVVCQLAFRLSPADSMVSANAEGDFSWAGALPHAPSRRGVQPGWVSFQPARDAMEIPVDEVLCVVATNVSTLPRECRVLVRLDGTGGAAVERNPQDLPVTAFTPWFVSEVQAAVLAQRAAAGAQADGLSMAGGELPPMVSLSALTAPAPGHGRLPAAFA